MLRTRSGSASLSVQLAHTDAQLRTLIAARAEADQNFHSQLAALQAAHDYALAHIAAQEHELEGRRQRLLISKAANHVVARPFNITHLPPEILAEIASHLAGTAALAPLLRVSRAWRDTLEGTPALWAAVQFPATPNASSVRALARQLRLAKAAPLSIRAGGAPWAPHALVAYWEAMAHLRDALPLVRVLEVAVAARSQLGDVLLHLVAPAPSLRRLVLRGPGGAHDSTMHIPPNVLANAFPETLVLDHVGLPPATFVRPGLRRLDLSAVFARRDHVDAVEDSIRLVVDTLETLAVTGSQWLSPTIVVLDRAIVEAPVLSSLSLDNAPLGSLLAQLRMPALRRLSLRRMSVPVELDLLRSASALEELELVDVSPIPSRSPLQLTRLTTLRLQLSDPAALLSTLHVPALKNLDVRMDDSAITDVSVFTDAIEAFLNRFGLGLMTLAFGVRNAPDAMPLHLAVSLPVLRTLHLHGVPPTLLLSQLPSVDTLKLNGGQPDLALLAAALPEIQSLAIDGSDTFDGTLFRDSTVWAGLEDLELSHCPSIAGAVLVDIAAHRSLRSVEVWSCASVSAAHRAEIMSHIRL